MALKYKTKGCYNTPDPLAWDKSVSEMQPPGWHRDWSAVISARAAVANMVHRVDIEQFIRCCTNPYDFACAIKVRRGDLLMHGGVRQQRVTRYYVSKNGAPMYKQAPALGPVGAFKKANGVSESQWAEISKNGTVWDVRVCTKNKSKYESRDQAICAGYNVTICNDIRDLHFDDINYDWYVQEAAKLVV